MTAFAACLFVVAALVSAHVIVTNWIDHAGAAERLRRQIRECPETISLGWKVVERVQTPTLATLRKDRFARLRRHPQWTLAERPGLEWPGMETSAERAA